MRITFQLLQETANEAAAAVLVAALDSPRAEIREQAFQALMARRSMAGQHELVRRWDKLDESWKKQLAAKPGRISSAVRDAILGPDPQLRANGCSAVLAVRDYDLLPALLNVAEQPSNPQSADAAGAVLALADSLYEDLAGPRDYSQRRDPQLLREYMVGVLEQSVSRFARHRRREMIEAFLVLANRDNATLKRLLSDPHDSAYLPLIDLLTHGVRPGVMRLALNYVEDPHAPLTAINVLAHRADEPFVRHLLAKIGPEPSPAAKANIKRMESIWWLRDNLPLVDAFDDALQQATVQLAVCSSMNRQQVYKLLERLLERGTVGGRRAAAAALAPFKGVDANQLATRCLADADPQVVANVLGQLRERGIPGAMTRLIEAVESREPLIKKAAQDCLSEFTLKRYIAAFDMLDPEVRKSTGALVRRVDPDAIGSLREELAVPGRSRRIRAVDMIVALEAVSELEDGIIALLRDDDHFVRVAAAGALANSNTAPSREALREALLDRSVAVHEAAETSLRLLLVPSVRKTQPPAPITPVPPAAPAADTVSLTAPQTQVPL